MKKLGEICDVRDGTHDSPKFYDEGYPLITSKNITSGFIDFKNVKYISKEDFDNINKRSLVEFGDIIFAMIGTIGSPVIVDTTKSFAIKNVALFKFSNNKWLLNKYLKELLEFEFVTEQIDYLKKGSNRDFVSLTILRNILIPLPPLDIQRKIISEIEEIETIEETNNKKIKNNYRLILEKIEYIKQFRKCNLSDDLIAINEATIQPLEYPDKKFTYVDIDSIKNGTGEIGLSKKITGISSPSRARRLAGSNSTIISTVRPNLKAFAYIENEIEDCIFSTGFAILKSKDTGLLLNKWIYFNFMYSIDLMEQIIAAMPKGQYPSINNTNIRGFSIYLPPLEIQHKIIAEIEALENEILNLNDEISNAGEMKRVVLTKYLQ